MIKIEPRPDTSLAQTNIDFADYWTAMYTGAYEYADSNDVTEEEAEFAKGIKYIVSNQIESALPIMKGIYYSKTENDSSMMKYVSKSILWHYYLSENRLDICNELDFRYNKTANADEGKAAVIFKKLIGERPFTRNIYAKTDTLLFTNDDKEMAIIKVVINGQEFEMAFDSGAMVTVVSKEVADLCNLTPIVDKLNVFGTSNEKNLGTYQAISDSIQIGNSKFNNLIVNVSAEGNFEFGIPYIWTFFKIDGLIGWDIVKHFESEFDFENNRLILNKPIRKSGTKQNFFWIAHPIVKATDPRGMPFNFFYDSGAETSHYMKFIIQKLPETELDSDFEITWGLGGSVWHFTDTYPEYVFFVEDHKLTFSDMRIQDNDNLIYIYDATIGNNVCGGGKIKLDPLNGLFEIIPPAKAD